MREAVPGVVWFVTGLHTGDALLRIEWHEQAPPVPGEDYQEVVEVSFTPRRAALALTGFGSHACVTLPRAVPTRLRYSIRGIDAGQELDTRIDEPAPEHGLIQLWPAPPRADAVLRCESRAGRYWHTVPRR